MIMKRTTLLDFAKAHNRDLGESYISLLTVLEKAAFSINDKLSKNGLIEEQGETGTKNVYGEEVQKLDAYANELLTSSFLSCPSVSLVGSEELDTPKSSENPEGKYVITHDPLDGSSNIDTNLPVGTIFGVYPKSSSILQLGSTLISSGYILYGPSLILVYATLGSVNGFTYDSSVGKFVLSHPDIKIGEKKIYSINEGNWNLFSENDQAYISNLKKEGGYSLRYVGSMVADIHRTLLRGGIFLYPSDSTHPDGKLRLLYEVAPLSFLIIQAGGVAVSRGVDALDILPERHDQRVPIAIGSKAEIEKYQSFAVNT